ncbi:MAG: hypothetical protein K0R73_1196 [Candidatus Midichloriaceae bacterium]|jgi:hypothetical protein|nr:hypothetical protein [Candidatus Midichloriaceae bacterium]
MKKFGMIIAAALIAQTANAAEAPEIKVTGKLDFQAGSVKQKAPFRNSSPAAPSNSNRMNDRGFVNDTTLDFEINGKVNSDFTYGGFIRAHGDTSVATNQEIYFGDKAKVYVQHNKFGRIEAGNIPGAGGLFEMDTVNTMQGTFGIDGFWSQWVSDRSMRTSRIYQTALPGAGGATIAQLAPGGEKETRSLEFIVSPNIMSNYSGHYYSDAPKINFFTKPVPELTLGVAFIPDLDSAGTVSNRAPRDAGPQDDRQGNPATYRNIVSGGFMYENKKLFSKDFGIKTGLAGEYGKSKVAYMNNLRSYEAGLMFNYKNMKLGSTYGSWMDSLTLKQKTAGGRHGSYYYTVSFSQNLEKLGYSVSAMESRRAGGIEVLGYQLMNSQLAAALPSGNINAQSFADPKKNRFRNIVLDVDYKLAPGFLPYAGLSVFKFNESHGAIDSGYVLLGGVRLTF